MELYTDRNNKPDQAEIEADNAQLRLRIADTSARLQAEGKTPPATPTLTGDLLTDNETLKAHLAVLDARKASPAATAKPQTLTERALAARAKMQIDPAD